ncbi:hypothetical protein ACFQ0B_81165 [Nonomuraea thailandensis]
MALNQPQPLAFDPSQLIGHTWRLARLDLTLLFRNRMAFFTAIAFPCCWAAWRCCCAAATSPASPPASTP